MASFSVAALMKEEPAVVRRFVAHYRAIGAERIYVLHDGPLDPLIAAGLDPAALDAEGVTLVGCDAAFWMRERGALPGHVQERLRAASAVAHQWCGSDWLLCCDADEYVIDRMPVAEFLDRIPPEVDAVLIRPAEAVWGPGEDIDAPFGSTWFRRRSTAAGLRRLRLWGPLFPLLWRGLVGHSQGKQFVRRGARFDAILAHTALRDGVRVSRQATAVDPALGVMEIAHFEAVCYGRWREKLMRRLAAEEKGAMEARPWRRRAHIALFRCAGWFGEGARRALFRGLYCVGARRLRRMEEAGLAFRDPAFRALAAGRERTHAQAVT